MRTDREKMLERARNGEERNIIARALDRAEIVRRSGLTQVTGFHDPYQTGLIISTVKSCPGLSANAWGGYPGAERVRTAIHEIVCQPGPQEYDIVFLFIRGNFKKSVVNHRDFLGAMLALGLKREMIGDLIVAEEGAAVAAAGEVVPFVRANLVKVGRVGVSVAEIEPQELQLPEQSFKEVRATVPSLRLDAVAAAGFGVSRSRLVSEIQAEKYSVNWRSCRDPSTPVRQGDILSARGRGRVRVAEVKGPLKSGRMLVVLHRYV